ncbi:hypothetical protein Hypma_005995 [Hypsizygus marmoreus]|uniref:Uncharacterized protein n=1 Tax=Hypsizygus marmoreus TaxID=39966 RepID=A0A369KII0_HYPMA|nr:hypothetical protein Hypma_005995 [Hypsizygus marmoreus]
MHNNYIIALFKFISSTTLLVFSASLIVFQEFNLNSHSSTSVGLFIISNSPYVSHMPQLFIVASALLSTGPCSISEQTCSHMVNCTVVCTLLHLMCNIETTPIFSSTLHKYYY